MSAAFALPTVVSPGGASSSAASKPQDYDLTYTIAQHLDRHMILPMIEFLQENKVYPDNQLWDAKLELVRQTKMIDFYAEEYKRWHKQEADPATFGFNPREVFTQLKDWKEACRPLLDVINDRNLVNRLREENKFTLEGLASYKVNEDHVRDLYRYAKLSYDCGRYRDAADFLYYFRLLSKDEEKRFLALWGKLAAEILMVNCETALEDLRSLREAIDQRKGDHVVQLQQRTWLIHWSLFLFNMDNGHSEILDFLFQDPWLLNAIQTTCPHILRYLTCSVIINKRKKNVLKDIVRVLGSEKDTYSDPITTFLHTLYVEFDFETAQKKLKECEVLLANDFFISLIADEFLESARQLLFETYARTHQCIDINVLAERLDIKVVDSKDGKADSKAASSSSSSSSSGGGGKKDDDGDGDDDDDSDGKSGSSSSVEQKLVELIRNARVDVKIDAKKNQIVMDARHPSIYQQVIEKTESLTQRSAHLAQEVDKRQQQRADLKADLLG